MCSKLILTAIFIAINLFAATAQQKGFDVDIPQQPANTALMALQSKYGFQLSFNDAELAKRTVSCKGNFTSVDGILDALLTNIPYSFDKIGDVYVVYHNPRKLKRPETESITITGQVVDGSSGESLPYTSVSINDELRITDINGGFSYVAFANEWLDVKMSYLGYHPLDTLVMANKKMTFRLMAVPNILTEAKVVGSPIKYGAQVGKSVSTVRMSPRMTNYLPGGPLNNLQQLINLQPGIQGNGSTNGFTSIWGSYPGHNLLTFDGIPLYSHVQNNELIFPINAMVVKDVLIEKGAMASNLGDRVGGIVDLTGMDGRSDKAEAMAMASSTLLGGYVSSPLGKKTSLVMAARKNWNSNYLETFEENAGFSKSPSIDVWMPYKTSYQDINLKLSHWTDRGNRFYVSTYANGSKNELNVHPDEATHYADSDRRQQIGGALFYGFVWGNGNQMNLKLTATKAERQQLVDTQLALAPYPNNQWLEDVKFSVDNRYPINNKQFLETGLSFHSLQTNADVQLTEQTFNIAAHSRKASFYLRNHINANPKLLMDIGIRFDYLWETDRLFAFPRLRGSYGFTDHFKMNFNWGVYAQYFSCVPLYDGLGNVDYVWRGATDRSDFVQSNLLAVGASYTKGKWDINMEGYQKQLEGLNRYLTSSSGLVMDKGTSRVTGLDLLVKRELGNHAVWQSVTVGRAMEQYQSDSIQKPSPFSRLFESKTTLMLGLKDLKAGTSLVYGTVNEADSLTFSIPDDFFRLDAMVNYSFVIQSIDITTGATFYNITNRANLSSLKIIHLRNGNNDEVKIGAGGIPLLFELFVKLKI